MRRPNTRKAFPIVGIGASAGGLKAFTAFLNALPADPGKGFVLVPHLAPQYESHLTEILSRSTKLPVSVVRDGQRVLPSRVYVVPPNRRMIIRNGVLHLAFSRGKSARLNPIDGFLRSLAKDRRGMAIGVLLSGEGSDGTEGLRAVKAAGGMTFAQDEKTADHRGMPQSAIRSGCVDFVLSPAEIARKVSSKSWNADYKGILALLGAAKGVEFERYKRGTLLRRIQRRMALKGLEKPEQYAAELKRNPAELELLYRDILISVTAFFREPDAFKALKSTVYGHILRNLPAHAPLRIWVPGCSTGEEAYSHAINLLEHLGDKADKIPFQIFATDLNPAAIQKARAGFYPKKIRAEVSSERLRRFFVETKNGYQIAPSIRGRCVFAPHNLVQDPPFSNLDLISCRNLLIYLEPTLQAKALQAFHYALKPRGILMLGRSETVGEFLGRFSPLSAKKPIFFKRTPSSKMRLEFVPYNRFLQSESAVMQRDSAGAPEHMLAPDAFDLRGELESVLPPRYIPNGVIVSRDLEIIRFLGDTTLYLRPRPGKPSLNLHRMASGEFLLQLKAAIHSTRTSAASFRKEVAAPFPSGTRQRVQIEVIPITTSHLHAEYFLVLFEEVIPEEPAKAEPAMTARGKESRRVLRLQEDLAVSSEHLKSIIQEQEATNARLKSANEELLASNEELQSMNEEFETAKEELQTTNEELLSSNEDVVHGNQILERANNDLTNLLANINMPVVLLGPDLSIHRVTPPAEKVLGLSAAQIGRSILDHPLPIRLPDLKPMLLNVIKTGKVQELKVQDRHGRWYFLWIRPYRTQRSKIQGAVLTLVDMHDRMLAENAMRRLATFVRDSNDAIIIRDLKGRILAWNRGAEKMYGYTEAEALRMNIRRLIPEDRRAEKRAWLKTLLAKKGAPPLETHRRAKNGRILDVSLTATVLLDKHGRPMEVATTEHDITERKRAERELKLLYARVVSAQETERMRVARELHDGVGQILSGVKFRLEALPGKIGALNKAAQKEIDKASGIIDQALAETRRVSQNLMPTELEDLGLHPALRALCRDFSDRLRIPVTLKYAGMPKPIDHEPALALYRIIQEALNNVGTHARASRVTVALSAKGAQALLTLSDDGRGSTAAQRLRRTRLGGMGLANIRERAESLGGAMGILSRPGKGTRLLIRLPLSGRGGIKR